MKPRRQSGTSKGKRITVSVVVWLVFMLDPKWSRRQLHPSPIHMRAAVLVLATLAVCAYGKSVLRGITPGKLGWSAPGACTCHACLAVPVRPLMGRAARPCAFLHHDPNALTRRFAVFAAGHEVVGAVAQAVRLFPLCLSLFFSQFVR